MAPSSLAARRRREWNSSTGARSSMVQVIDILTRLGERTEDTIQQATYRGAVPLVRSWRFPLGDVATPYPHLHQSQPWLRLLVLWNIGARRGEADAGGSSPTRVPWRRWCGINDGRRCRRCCRSSSRAQFHKKSRHSVRGASACPLPLKSGAGGASAASNPSNPDTHLHTTRTTGYFENSCVFINKKARSIFFVDKQYYQSTYLYFLNF
jgi:hypothetical protein